MQDEGYLAKILVGDGTKDIPVGTLVAIVVDDKDDVRLTISPYSTSSMSGMGFTHVHGQTPLHLVHGIADGISGVPSTCPL